MTETDIQNLIRKELSEYGLVLRLNTGRFFTLDGRHISSGLPKGTSDLLFLGKNKTALIEVKTSVGRLSSEQRNFINKVQSLGHIAGTARSVDEALKLINITED